MLAGFEAYDAELHSAVMKNRIIFDDLQGCNDRDIQKILREIDTADLAKALKGASPQLREKIFRNMSSRAASLLREDMEYIGPVRLEDVEDAQGRMVRVATRLKDAGEIIIARPGDRFL
jgi:flagellar motor switch protein FliG